MAEQEDLNERLENAIESKEGILDLRAGDHINEASEESFNETIKELSSIKRKLGSLLRTSETPRQVEKMIEETESAL